jgi:hypothetical protein
MQKYTINVKCAYGETEYRANISRTQVGQYSTLPYKWGLEALHYNLGTEHLLIARVLLMFRECQDCEKF